MLWQFLVLIVGHDSCLSCYPFLLINHNMYCCIDESLVIVLGENENLRRAIRGRPVAKKGLRILSMDGGGMKGLATVQMLKQIEQGTGKRIHEMFDLICGTSTGGMLAMALGIKRMTLDQCEEIYTKLGESLFPLKVFLRKPMCCQLNC